MLSNSKIFKPKGIKKGLLTKMVRCRHYSLAMLVLSLTAALILCALSVSASLTVTTDKNTYNLGDQVVASYDFSMDRDFSGLLKLSLTCSNYTLDFYTVPANVAAGEKSGSAVAPLSISEHMLGKCYVDGAAVAYDRSSNVSGSSSVFNVSNDVVVGVLVPKASYMPLDTVEISGTVAKSHLLPATALITFDNETGVSSVVNNVFSYSISLPKDVKSGMHGLGFFVNDSYGNSGSSSAQFSVIAVPTKIVNTLSSQSVKPKELFTVSVLVYDQANDLVGSKVEIAVADSAGSAVLSAANSTGSAIQLSFPAGQEPGIYTLTSSGKGLSSVSRIAVEEVESVSIGFDKGILSFKNTGNIDYVKEVQIGLAGQTSYLIAEYLNLKPGEVYDADLSREVYGGTYNISFPALESASAFENVNIPDRRSLLKKTSDAFGMTGKNVLVTGTGTGKVPAKLAPFVLLVIVVAVAFFFVRNRKGSRSNSGSGMMDFGTGDSGSSQSNASSVGSPSKSNPIQTEEDIEQARIKRILEEKYKQQLARGGPPKPANLREDPSTKKFIKDMMKEKQFR